jgi:hypothetical protein
MKSPENPIAPVIQPLLPEAPPSEDVAERADRRESLFFGQDAHETRDLYWVLVGSGGLRLGWSVLLFAALYRFFALLLGTTAFVFDPALANFDSSPSMALIGELIPLLAMLAAVALVARMGHRKIIDYNLTGPRRVPYFLHGLAAGFAALSALVAALAWGGWLHFGPVALSGPRIFGFAALWGVVFLLVGLFEEGTFRCYLQFTLTRGIHFWWALAVIAVLCLDLLLRSRGNMGLVAFLWLSSMPAIKGNGAWGVYLAALLGLVPCLWLHLKKAPGSGFWQAAWVTSTLFGFIHTTNNGENWIGIFAAAAIGFVFCVSIWVTGSAWWAIGCHASWDWAESYFYGTADSGLVAKGHYLTTTPAGNALWSGGTDGPEGSLLVLGVILLLLAALFALYGTGKAAATARKAEPAAE